MPKNQKDNTQVVSFVKERDTKNTRRFAEVVADDSRPVVGTLYVANDVVASLGDPEALTITIAGA